MPNYKQNNSNLSREEKNPLDPQTIYTINEADILQSRKSQCVKHQWRVLNENELECLMCDTVIIANPEIINEQ